MDADWGSIRREFPALANWTHLNTATFGQVPKRTVEAVNAHFAHRDELACWDFLEWFDDADAVRAQAARLIHSEADDIAFIHNASEALGLLLGAIDWRPGDRIVTLEGEFPNNLYHPALLARSGVEFVQAKWEDFYDSLNERTRLVALSTVNYTTGFRPPVAEIAARLRSLGAMLYLDGTQSMGALEFDVRQVRPDVLAVHGYKWLLCPTGAAFAYVAPHVREWLHPSVIGWRSDRGWRDVDHLNHGAPEFKESAEKYEGGMLSFPLIYALGASLGLLLEIGPEWIERRVMALAEECRCRLRKLGARLLADELPHYDSPIIAARFEGRDASELARELKKRRVLVSARHGHVRVSVHFYNLEEDLDCLESALGAIL